MAGDRERRARPHPGAHRLGKDTRRLSPRPRPPERVAGRGPSAALRLAAEGAQLRHRAQPPRTSCRARLRAPGRRADRRHARRGAPAHAAHAAGHPHHDARVAVPPAHLAGARDAPWRRDRDPRRGARRRGDEARRASRALARAARAARRGAVPASRPLGHAAADGGDRALRRRHAPRDPARGRGCAEGARPAGRRAGRGHARARLHLGAVRTAARGRRRAGRRRRKIQSLDLALDLSGHPRARPRSTAPRSCS